MTHPLVTDAEVEVAILAFYEGDHHLLAAASDWEKNCMRAAITAALECRGLEEPPLRGLEEWQPIETAPKDGTKVLFFWPDGGVSLGDANKLRKAPKYYDRSEPWKSPTHWMPLPKPPSLQAAEGCGSPSTNALEK